MDKELQRKGLARLRRDIPAGTRRAKSGLIASRLFDTDEYRLAEMIMIYISFGSEPATDEIFDRILADGKRLCVPLCNTADFSMTAYEISGRDCLVPGSYGIPEPSGAGRQAAKDEIGLIIVPGLGFDRCGFRMGYGKGYYDRFLDGYSGASAGLCFSESLTDSICHDEFDKRVGMVITDREVINIA